MVQQCKSDTISQYCNDTKETPGAALSQTIHYNYKSQDRLTIPVCQTIHLHTVSKNNPQYAANGMGPSYVGLGWLGRTFPDLVCLEGRGMSGLAGPALHGGVAEPGNTAA